MASQAIDLLLVLAFLAAIPLCLFVWVFVWFWLIEQEFPKWLFKQ